MFIMRWERKYTIANYSSFIKAIINDLSEDSNSVEKIKKAFPDYFRKKQSPQMNTQIHNHREDKNPEDEPET
jgi:hypothetical protein